MRKKLAISLVVITGLLCAGLLVRILLGGRRMVCRLVCPQPLFKQGHEIAMALHTDEPHLSVPLLSRLFTNDAVWDCFTIEVRRGDGTLVPNFTLDGSWLLPLSSCDGFYYGSQPIPLCINADAPIDRPGDYTIRAVLLKGEGLNAIEVMRSDPVHVTVEPSSYAETRHYIDALTAELQTCRNWMEQLRVVERLGYTYDSRIAAILLDLERSGCDQFLWRSMNEVVAWRLPPDKDTRDMLLEEAESRGLTDLIICGLLGYDHSDGQLSALIADELMSKDTDRMIQAVRAAVMYPEDCHIDRLIEMACDTDCPARLHAIFALSDRSDEQSLEVLRRQIHDADDNIRSFTVRCCDEVYYRAQRSPDPVDFSPEARAEAEKKVVLAIADPRMRDRLQAVMLAISLLDRRELNALLAHCSGAGTEPLPDESAMLSEVTRYMANADEYARNLVLTAMQRLYHLTRPASFSPADFEPWYHEALTQEQRYQLLLDEPVADVMRQVMGYRLPSRDEVDNLGVEFLMIDDWRNADTP